VEACDHLAHGYTKNRSKRPFSVTGAVGEDIFVTHETMPGGHWRALLPATDAELYITFHVPSSCHAKPADAACTQMAYGEWALSLTFSESHCTETVTEVLPLRVIQRLRSKDPSTVQLDDEKKKKEKEQAAKSEEGLTARTDLAAEVAGAAGPIYRPLLPLHSLGAVASQAPGSQVTGQAPVAAGRSNGG
jgi:hypothetical protein